MPPEELAALEEAATAQFERTTIGPIGRDRLHRIAVDEAVAAYGQLPSFAQWQAAHASS